MVAIPKTKVSTIKNKEYHDLSSSYNGTTNFGVVFPSFAREMMPKAKFKMSVDSRILNAPMPVPTFGDMFLNHKHVFVPYVDICPQYYSFLTKQSYTIPGGISYVPTQLPFCDLPLIAQWCLSYFADFTVYKAVKQLNSPDFDEPVSYEPLLFERGYNQEDLVTMKDVFKDIWAPPVNSSKYFYGKPLRGSGSIQLNDASLRDSNPTFNDATNMLPLATVFRNGFGRGPHSLCGRWLAGQFAFNGDRTMSLFSDFWKFNGNQVIEGVDISTGGMWVPSEGYVDIMTADYISLFGPVNDPSKEYVIAFKLRSTAKHFFNILVGLGYQFTPNLEDLVEPNNWLKILAFYKSWFNIYRPKRQLSFTSTYCYKFIKELELQDADSVIYPSPYHISTNLQEFLWDLATQPYYYLPQDYFGMSTLTPNADYTESGVENVSTFVPSSSPTSLVDANININGSNQPTVLIENSNYAASPAVMKIALGLLKHVNKNSIVGKSIADYIKVHFGVSLDSSHDLDKVYVIGDVSEDIDISPVMSMAQTEGDDLGAYAGRGYGESSKGNVFEFENTTNTHGIWLTLSCVIPKSGYYQGILRENRSLKPFDFPQSDLDALGFEVLSRSEVSSDYPVCNGKFNPHTYTDFDRKKGFGFVPRQSFIKVGRNVVAGEMALRSGVAQFDGYHLNRKIPYENVAYTSLYDSEGNTKVVSEFYAPRYIPNVVHDEFRRIDPTDRLGNYNRVFYSESVNDDHFIVGFKFKVDAWMPLLSLSDSFDTEQANTDDVKIAHS